jgi:hypothetical protein
VEEEEEEEEEEEKEEATLSFDVGKDGANKKRACSESMLTSETIHSPLHREAIEADVCSKLVELGPFA